MTETSYLDWVRNRALKRTTTRTDSPDDIAALGQVGHFDRRAREAILALDVAWEHVAQRFHGEDLDIQRAMTLFVASHLLWGR